MPRSSRSRRCSSGSSPCTRVATPRRCRWRRERWTGWPGVGSTTRWAEASLATAPTRLARAPLREDALRQRAAPAGLQPCLAAHASATELSDVDRRTPAEFVLGSMRSTDGGFLSSLDADTEGVEGATTPGRGMSSSRPWASSIARTLGRDPAGNWEGTNVLWLPGRTPDDTASQAGALDGELAAARTAVARARDQRVPRRRRQGDRRVERDDDPCTQRRRSRARPPGSRRGCAKRARGSSRNTFGTRKEGCSDPSVPAEPRSRLLRGLRVARTRSARIFEATGEPRWFSSARGLARRRALERFADPARWVLHDRRRRGTPLVRPKDLLDTPCRAGTRAMCELLVRLSLLTGEGAYRRQGGEHRRTRWRSTHGANPTAFGHALVRTRHARGSDVGGRDRGRTRARP